MREEKQIVKEGYDSIVEAYTAARQQMKQANKKYLNFLTGRLAPNSKLLDIGCGSGIPITKLLAKDHDLTGVDISPRQVERARALVPEATFLEGDITQLSFPDGTFDAIVSFYAIIHIPREEHRELFRRVHRMLKRGGFLLATLGSDAWESTQEYEPFGVKMHWSHYGAEEYDRMLSMTGFRILKSSVEREEFLGEYEETLYILAEKAQP